VMSGQLAQGREVARFEAAVASQVGVAGAAATSSGTSALLLALLALGAGPGSEIVMPSYVCASLATATLAAGATPVLADISPETFGLCPEDTRRRLSSRTRAVLVPHLFGQPADLDALGALGVPLVEDLAMSLGARWRGRPVGSFGLLAVCSFYATKLMTTGEGGMVLGQDEQLLSDVRDLRGVDDKETFRLRYNAKMTEMAAALGSSQLGRLPELLARRRQLASRYHEVLGELGLPAPSVRAGAQLVWYRYVLVLDGDADAFLREMRQRGIDCRRPVFRPLHRYLGLEGYPQTEAIYRGAVSIPLYPALTDSEVDQIAEALRAVLPRYGPRQVGPGGNA
jgi:perosamine synthetase